MPFFNSNNVDNNYFSAYTNISSASTFIGTVRCFNDNSKSTRWEFSDKSSQTTGTTRYNIPGSGSRLLKAVVNRRSDISVYDLRSCGIIGSVNLFEQNDILQKQTVSSYIDFRSNPSLSAITLPTSSNRFVSVFSAGACSLSGTVDLSSVHFSGFPGDSLTLFLQSNSKLNSIILRDEEYTLPVSILEIDTCQIGTIPTITPPGCINFNTTVDLSRFKALGGHIHLTNGGFPHGNSGITNVLFPTSTTGGTIFSLYINGLPNFTGNSYNLDLSWTNGRLGQDLSFNNLTKITGVTFSSLESNSITSLDLGYCDLQGNLDLSNLHNLNRNININNNTGLTSVTFTNFKLNEFVQFNASVTGLRNIDFTNTTSIGGFSCNVFGCPYLTGLTLPDTISQSGSGVYILNLSNSDFRDLDFSNTYIAHPNQSVLIAYSNPNLTGFTFPKETANSPLGVGYNLMDFSNCNIKKFGIENLSGTNNNILSVFLQSNSMTANIVNEILVKFDNLGWTGNTMNIDGNNAAPDHVSGGFDGIAAKLSLSGKGWTLITS